MIESCVVFFSSFDIMHKFANHKLFEQVLKTVVIDFRRFCIKIKLIVTAEKVEKWIVIEKNFGVFAVDCMRIAIDCLIKIIINLCIFDSRFLLCWWWKFVECYAQKLELIGIRIIFELLLDPLHLRYLWEQRMQTWRLLQEMEIEDEEGDLFGWDVISDYCSKSCSTASLASSSREGIWTWLGLTTWCFLEAFFWYFWFEFGIGFSDS